MSDPTQTTTKQEQALPKDGHWFIKQGRMDLRGLFSAEELRWLADQLDAHAKEQAP